MLFPPPQKLVTTSAPSHSSLLVSMQKPGWLLKQSSRTGAQQHPLASHESFVGQAVASQQSTRTSGAAHVLVVVDVEVEVEVEVDVVVEVEDDVVDVEVVMVDVVGYGSSHTNP